jgi:hypothetical protein
MSSHSSSTFSASALSSPPSAAGIISSFVAGLDLRPRVQMSKQVEQQKIQQSGKT